MSPGPFRNGITCSATIDQDENVRELHRKMVASAIPLDHRAHYVTPDLITPTVS